MNFALCPSVRPMLRMRSRLCQTLAVWVILLTGGKLSAQVIEKNVILGGTLDISPISNIFPAPVDNDASHAWARMMIMHTTIPGTTKGVMYRTSLVDEYIWGEPPPNAFGPGNVSPNTQNRILASQGFRYKSNGTGLNTSESIPIKFSNSLGTITATYTLKINIKDPSLGPTITEQPIATQSVPPNGWAGMHVVAGGPGPHKYQWYEGYPPNTQNPIGGATASSWAMGPRPIGQYHFWVNVSNDLASVSSLNATVNVSNPPVANIGGPYTVGEMDTIALSALASSDAESPTLAYEWDLDNNGIFGQLTTPNGEERVGAPAFTAVGVEGPGTHPLTVHVFDGSDMMSSATTVMNIVNAPPRAIFSANGAQGKVTFSEVKDSPGDLAAGIQYSFDLDNDGVFEIGYSATAHATVPADKMAAYLDGRPVRGRAKDRDGGVSEYVAGYYGRGVLVTTLTDENNEGSWEVGRKTTSLREAIALAESDIFPATIYFDPAILTSQITPVPCNVNYPITTVVIIRGPATGNGVALTGPAGTGIRGFSVTATGTLILDRLTLTNFTGASPAPAGKGGAISSDGTLVVRRCTLHGNRAAGASEALGGAIYSGGGAVSLENSTFFNNKTTLSNGIGFSIGGAVYAYNTALNVSNCTVTGNTANDTRGIAMARNAAGSGASATINNSIIADAVAGAADFSAAGLSGAPVPPTSGSNNIMRSATAFAGSFSNVDPKLSPLALNGGTTQTISPVRGSPAINRGAVMAAITTDGRGFARPFAKRYDIGAVEFDGLVESLVVTTAADENDGTSDVMSGAGTSLREALTYAGEHAGEDTVTFHASLGGQTINLTTGWNDVQDVNALRVVNQTVTVQGLTAFPGVAIGIGGGLPKRHFGVEAGGSLTLSHVHLGLGKPVGNGGCVWSAGSFKALASTFSSNTAMDGGAVYAEAGAALCQMENCTFTTNTATGTAGAVYAGAAQTVLRHLTISGNTANGSGASAVVCKQTQVELCNSLVLGNTGDGIGLVNGAALNAQSTNNIIGSGSTGGLINGVSGNLTGIQPSAVKLGALGFNGAATPTLALESGSIAVNQAIPIAGVPADQRGTVRPTGSAPDIGAFEDTTNNGAGDADLDTVSNLDEYKNGTNIFSRDTDNDGYNDATELLAGTSGTSGASIPPANHIECVLGAAAGLGLDLAGTFTHAVNVGTNGAAGTAGSASFTADNAPGVSVVSTNNSANWFPVEFGASVADTTLEKMFSSNRWGAAAQPVQVTLSGLTPGRKYKLQLLFGEACCPGRTFDVIIGGTLAVDNFMPAAAQGGASVRYAGSAIVREVAAVSSSLTIVLSSASVPPAPGLNTSPILSGLTLEDTGATSAFAQWCALQGLPLNGTQDLANPSGDGVSNLVKFAFNLAPMAGDLNKSNVTIFAAPDGGSGLPAISSGAGGGLTFDFIRRVAASAPEITCVPQISADFMDWQPVNLNGAVITAVSPGWERVALTVPAAAGGRVFGRVEVKHSN